MENENLKRGIVVVVMIIAAYLVIRYAIYPHIGFPSEEAVTAVFPTEMTAQSLNWTPFSSISLTGAGNTQGMAYTSTSAWPNTITLTAQEIHFDSTVDAQNAYNKGILEYVNRSLTENDMIQSLTQGPYNYTIVTYPTTNTLDEYLVIGQKKNLIFYFDLKGGTFSEALNFMGVLVNAT